MEGLQAVRYSVSPDLVQTKTEVCLCPDRNDNRQQFRPFNEQYNFRFDNGKIFLFEVIETINLCSQVLMQQMYAF